MFCKYYKQCGSCYYLRDKDFDSKMFEGDSNEKGHCIYLKIFCYPDEEICSYYRNKYSYVPGNDCYITTIVCKMLHFEDNCDVLETLRSFRNNIMQKEEKYKSILYEYDAVGPKIAECIVEEDNLDLVDGIFNFYILPTADLIKQKRNTEAVKKYKQMTESLEKYYGIEYDNIIPESYDYTKGGHGVKKIGTI